MENPFTYTNEQPKDVLPFKRIDNIEHELTWDDFDQDETGKCVFIYRALQNMNTELAFESGHQSRAASFGETREQILERLGTDDIQALSLHATQFFQGNSPILHTTRSKIFADGYVGEQGVVVTYKIPKSWLLEPENQPLIGNEAESELDFFHQLPKEFLDKIEQKGELEIIFDPLKNAVETPIIDVPDLPPPPPDERLIL